MKKAIELLLEIKDYFEADDEAYPLMVLTKEARDIIEMVDEILAILKAPRWIPYENLVDAIGLMQKAQTEVEKLPYNDQRKIRQVLEKISAATGAIEVLIPLPLPRWETPEQWEKRTGKAWPYDWAVYIQITNNNGYIYKWKPTTLGDALLNKSSPVWKNHQIEIVCATEAGPPPDGWRPE